MKKLMRARPAARTPDPAPLLRRWLNERRELLSRYCALSTALHDERAAASITGKLDRFCEVLVDYVSAGHFEVYRQLLDTRANPHAGELYRLIVPTTTIALDFNDRHFRGAGRTLRDDLSRLGQVLASRFDWEDALMGARARAVA